MTARENFGAVAIVSAARFAAAGLLITTRPRPNWLLKSLVGDRGTVEKRSSQARGKKQKIDVENYPPIMKEAASKWAFLGRESGKNRVYFLAHLA